jgi:hypothetical protein
MTRTHDREETLAATVCLICRVAAETVAAACAPDPAS